MAQSQTAPERPVRRRRSREETKHDLLEATLRLLRRDGVLAGVNLREVAKEAGVNHGQIYMYFGTRQMLLRAAIAHLVTADQPDPRAHWGQPFVERRRAMWRWALGKPDMVKLEALLALDNDPDFSLFPEIERTRHSLERDRATGALPADADGLVMHAMAAATHLGYCIFRETIARDLEIDPNDLDARAAAVFDKMLTGMTCPSRVQDTRSAEMD